MKSTSFLLALPLILAPALHAKPIPAIHEEYNATLKAQMPLEQGWANPPRLARTRCWWWWLNGNTDKETITRDLEAMKANGLGGANVIDAGGDTQEGNKRVPHGPDFGSKEWRELFRHTMAEADRLGLELGFNIQSGWNLGGPSVPIEESSKKATFSTTTTEGGKAIDLKLAEPPKKSGFYRDVAVVAVPLGAPAGSTAKLTASSSQANLNAGNAMDGNAETFWVSNSKQAGDGPSEAKPQWLELQFDRAVRADRLVITPRPGYGPKRGKLQVIENNKPREIAGFSMEANAPATIEFPATDARNFRIVFTDAWDAQARPAAQCAGRGSRVVLGRHRAGARRRTRRWKNPQSGSEGVFQISRQFHRCRGVASDRYRAGTTGRLQPASRAKSLISQNPPTPPAACAGPHRRGAGRSCVSATPSAARMFPPTARAAAAMPSTTWIAPRSILTGAKRSIRFSPM